MVSFYVYKHTNKTNGKVYIGITSMTPSERWKNGKGYTSGYFKKAVEKYGWDNFTHEILFDGLTKKQAAQKEIELIALYKSNNPKFGYNLSIGGEKTSLGMRLPEEVKKKISENSPKIWLGKTFSETHKRHLRENHADCSGENSPVHKLTQNEVDTIRAIYKPHDKVFGRNALALKYGVDKSTIQKIVSRKNWIKKP